VDERLPLHAFSVLRECLAEPGVRLRRMVERVQEYLPIRIAQPERLVAIQQ
jgi:hypothetical protein